MQNPGLMAGIFLSKRIFGVAQEYFVVLSNRRDMVLFTPL